MPLSDARGAEVAGVHPLARIYSATGKKAIYVALFKVECIVGMGHDESRGYIRALQERVIQPKFIYRHYWRYGDFLRWDNRSVAHKSFRDYDYMEGPIMHRVIL